LSAEVINRINGYFRWFGYTHFNCIIASFRKLCFCLCVFSVCLSAG